MNLWHTYVPFLRCRDGVWAAEGQGTSHMASALVYLNGSDRLRAALAEALGR